VDDIVKKLAIILNFIVIAGLLSCTPRLGYPQNMDLDCDIVPPVLTPMPLTLNKTSAPTAIVANSISIPISVLIDGLSIPEAEDYVTLNADDRATRILMTLDLLNSNNFTTAWISSTMTSSPFLMISDKVTGTGILGGLSTGVVPSGTNHTLSWTLDGSNSSGEFTITIQ
jgi:hypothetical protein